MALGIVKWFNRAKGVGFITPDDGEEDVFINAAAIPAGNLESLAEGQKVEFESVRGKQGLFAQTVRSLN